MGRSANSFAFLLVFVLLALVIYFIYQAATGVSGTNPSDQALAPQPKKEAPNPDIFVSALPRDSVVDPTPPKVDPAPPVADPKDKAPEATGEKGKSPGDDPAKAVEGEKKSDELPPPPKLSDTTTPAPPVEPNPPSVPTPAVSKQETLLPLDKEYTTEDGDTPWVLAVLLLGDGTRWQDIVAANPGLAQGGRAPDKETALPAGVRVKTPKDGAPKPDNPVEPPPSGQGAEHKITAGDTLSAIMQRYYGESSMFVQKEILAANPDLDPEVLQVNTTIKLPVIPGKGPKSGT